MDNLIRILELYFLFLGSYMIPRLFFSVQFIIEPFIKISKLDKIKNNILTSEEVKKIRDINIKSKNSTDKNFSIDTYDKQDLFYYKEVLKDKLSYEYQKNAEANFKNMDFNEKADIKLAFFLATGSYNIKKNQISIGRHKESASHEMIHVSTACYSKEDKIAIVGFHQSKQKKFALTRQEIGRAINEAYTNKLDASTFNKDIFTGGYKDQTIILLLLEELLGTKDALQQDFLNMDLMGMIEKFKTLGLEDEILKTILLLDASVDNNHIFLSYIFLYITLKKVIEIFLKTSPTEEQKKEFFNIIAENKMFKKYVQMKKIYNYQDDMQEKKKKKNLKRYKH